MPYEYVPHPKRQLLRWPNGKRLAVIVTLNLEYWDMLKDTTEPYYAGGPPAIPDPVPGNILDVPNFSWREYGQRVGIWRLFEAFDAVGVPASCTVNAKVGLERRAMVDAVLEHAKSQDDVWWATREEIAAWYMENHESHVPADGT